MPEPAEEVADNPADPSSPGTQSQELLKESERLYTEGKLGQALLVVEAISKSPDLADQISVQKLVLDIIVNGRRNEHAKVLGVEQQADTKQIASSFRKRAHKVHPDKCSCFGAEEAFQHLTAAVNQLQAKEEGGFVKTEVEAHAWWDAWEGDDSSKKRKRKWEGDRQEESETEMLNLRQCPIEELKKIVAARQKAVLQPAKGSEEAKQTPAQRQQRVRTARGILNERLSYVRNDRKKPGGFI